MDDLRLVSGTVLHGVARAESARQEFCGPARHCPVLHRLAGATDDPEITLSMLLRPTIATSMTVCLYSRQARPCYAKNPLPSTYIKPSGLWRQPASAKCSAWKRCRTRFIPAVIEAKRCIDAGMIGSIRLIQGNFSYSVPAGVEARFFNRELGGGAMLDRGVYLISLAQHLLGRPHSISTTACLGTATVRMSNRVISLLYAGGAFGRSCGQPSGPRHQQSLDLRRRWNLASVRTVLSRTPPRLKLYPQPQAVVGPG